MKAWRYVAAVVLIAATISLWAWWPARPRAESPQPSAAIAQAAPNAMQVLRVSALAPSAAPHESAATEDSLRDTSVDGSVSLDANGRPKADRELRRLFDYFLARTGERTPAAIRDDLWAHLRNALHLDAAAQGTVLDWFDKYVAAQHAAIEMARSGDLRVDAARLRDLHRDLLGDALARAWFGADDDYAAYTAERLALARDKSLSAAEKAQRMAELEAKMDPLERENYHAATDFQIASLQSKQFDAEGTDAATRHAERAALWGEEAATRLAALDQAEADWNARLAAYAQAREAVLANTSLGASAREAQLAALLGGFSEVEQRRVLSLVQANLLRKR